MKTHLQAFKAKVEKLDREFGIIIRALAFLFLITCGILFMIVSLIWMIIAVIQLAFAGSWIAISLLLITGVWIIYIAARDG